MEGWTNALAIIGGGLSDYEVETGTYTPTSNVARPTISFANTHSTTPFLVAMVQDSNTNLTNSNENYIFVFFDYYRWFGGYVPGSSSNTSTKHYATALYRYTGSNGTPTQGGVNCTSNSDGSGATYSTQSRYHADEGHFYPNSNSTSRYWGNGKTFKWIAVWKKSA